MVVARADLDPGVGDADERLGEVIVFQTGGAEHGAGAGAVGAPDKSLAAEFGKWITHFAFLSRPFRHRRREKPCHSKSRPPRRRPLQKLKAITLIWMMARISRKFDYAITRFCRWVQRLCEFVRRLASCRPVSKQVR